MRYVPADVQVDLGKQILTVIWQDEHTSRFRLFNLRRECPCVECRGGHQHMRAELDRAVLTEPPAGRIEVAQLETVGNYGLQIFWSDGHSEGIYSWKALRNACPCSACYPEGPS